MIDNLIVRMDNWLRDNRADYYSMLLPGAADGTLTEFEQRFSLRLPDDFRTLYQWRNGQPQGVFAGFQDNRMSLVAQGHHRHKRHA